MRIGPVYAVTALQVHLGDTAYNKLGRYAPPATPGPVRRSCRDVTHFENSLVVPHRTSQWLPLSFPPPSCDNQLKGRAATTHHHHILPPEADSLGYGLPCALDR